MVDLLGLLKRLEWHTAYRYSDAETECPECEWNKDLNDGHEPDCQLKATIDALEAGTIKVMEA